MDPTRGDSRYNLNYSMSSIGLSLTDPADMYGSPALGAGGRPPSGGLLQNMGGGVPPMQRPTGGAPPATQCQTLHSPQHASQQQQQQQQQQQHQQQQQQQQHPQQQQQQRGLKRSGSDCYEDHHRSSGGLTLQGLDNVATNAVDDSVDNYNPLPNKKSPPANGKKTKGRVKIKMEYIDNKLRRYTTFSKRKTGIMKKAYELSTLTGTQVMLLVASETGHVYTFATRKLQPMITSEAGKQLIQTCLNSPDPPSVGGGDQRMSATGFEETELSYNIADEDSKVRQLIYGHHGHAHLGHPPAPPSHYSLEQSLMQSGYSGGQASPLSHAQYGGHGHHAHVPHVPPPHSTHSHMTHTHAQR